MSTKILFIHHSTGANLIREGKLRAELAKLNPDIEFWDHGYNLYNIFPTLLAKFTHHTGLRDNNGHITGHDYDIVLGNNSPREYAEIFARDASDSTLKQILGYDIIAFKNCYPTTKITSDSQLEENTGYYKSIRESLGKYPKKKFVLLTPPPLRRELTEPEYTNRAIKMVEWLKSKEFLRATTNIKVFDLFGLLTDEGGYLKKEYCRLLPMDSHPNKLANKTVAPLFAKYLTEMV